MRGRKTVPLFPTLHALPLSQPLRFHWRDEDDARQRSIERLERFRFAIENFGCLGNRNLGILAMACVEPTMGECEN